MAVRKGRRCKNAGFKKSGLIGLKEINDCYVVSECRHCGVMLNGMDVCFRCSI